MWCRWIISPANSMHWSDQFSSQLISQDRPSIVNGASSLVMETVEGKAPRRLDEGDEAAVRQSLLRMNLLTSNGSATFLPLTGGVSSLIVLVDAGGRRFCFKRALEKLNVAAEWYAPVARNRAEVQWMNSANAILPGIAPEVLGQDLTCDAFAMAYLDSVQFPLWKSELLSGRIMQRVAAAVALALVRIHSYTARCDEVKTRFANAEQFHALRIEPYLLATAKMNPVVAKQLIQIATQTAETRRVLVHGDVAPKNILIGGPHGVVLLDAECATCGDPAFDLAFCVNHLLLKMLVRPHEALHLGDAASALVNVYCSRIDWEPVASFDARLLGLLPALMLARVDGKSPVDYLNEKQRTTTRKFAREALERPPQTFAQMSSQWFEQVQE